MTSRRQALKVLLGGGAATLAAGAQAPLQLKFAPSAARAATPGKTLIKVFLRGGADGVNLFPPYADSAYYDLRPNIAVEPPNGSDPDSAIRLDNFFGAHPALAPLMEIWDDNNLGIMPATHFPDARRSHFDNQRWLELGFVGTGATGYFGRYLEQNPPVGLFQALVAGRNGITTSMRSSVPVTAVRRGSDFEIQDNLWCDGSGCATNNYHTMLQRLYEEEPENALPVESLAYLNGRDMSEKLNLFESLDDDYVPDAGGLDYSNSSFGDGLRLIAQLIKADVGLEVVATDWNIGWDTHSNQLPGGTSHGDLNFRYHSRINEGANDMLTFYRDMSAFRNDVTIVFGSEFGRTARQNGSRGTDHGFAAAWWAIGGAVNGGIQGAWPGLADQQLEDGRFLAMSIDYRDLLGEALTTFLGTPEAQLGTIFPNHQFTDNGLFDGATV